MSRLFCRIAGIVLVSVPVAAAAQEPLTVERAVDAALVHNASIRAARAGADEASARRVEAQSGWFPRVTISESWQRGDQPVFVFSSLLAARRFGAANFAIDALNHPDPIGFFRTSLAIEQSLFNGGRQRSASLIAAAHADSAAASASETSAAVALATTQAFARLLGAEAARRASGAALEAAREDHARAARRRDAGMLTEADVLALAVHVADLEQRTIQADGDAAAARAELNRLMGRPIESTIHAAEPSKTQIDRDERPDIAALLAEADRARPEIARAAAADRAAAATRRQARAALLPQVAGQAGIDISGIRIADRSASWVVGAELRWTFSTGGAEVAALKTAAAAAARARAEADGVRAGVHVDVITAVHQLETAQARQVASAAAVEQAQESQRIIRDRFDAGLAPVNDVLRASTAVLDADAHRVAAILDGIVAAAALRRALGRIP